MSLARKIFASITLSVIFLASNAQKATISGVVYDEKNLPVPGVNIYVEGATGQGTTSESNGSYIINVDANKDITLTFSTVSFKNKSKSFNLKPGEKITYQPRLTTNTLITVVVKDEVRRTKFIETLDSKNIDFIPLPDRSVESMLKSLPSVSSNNELSSSYSVRGGNFDENLVYVNDILVYRPFLVRSGQQEGLSFINPDMVGSIEFSAGGFDAEYGDKMSSVLDIRYRKPTEFKGSIGMSLLGGSLHLEDTLGSRATYTLGLRHKSNQYLLDGLQTQGDYKPSFTDVQSFITYDISKKIELNLLGGYARNKYHFIPQNRKTSFGTINQALSLRVFFDGQEVDEFETYTGAGSIIIKPTDSLQLKFIGSTFKTIEKQTYDILGQYFLDELETDFGEDDFGESSFNLGVGSWLDHARDELDAFVYSGAHLGSYRYNNNQLKWGGRIQREEINDKISEWLLIDSAGFSIPHSPDAIGYVDPKDRPDASIDFPELLKTKINLLSNRYSSFAQHTWMFSDTAKVNLTLGSRVSYWTLNDEWLFSPRARISFNPKWQKRDWLFKGAAGVYYQPPFYRELRDLNGNINTDLKSQRALHFVLGGDYNFLAWGRPFKYTSEIYYKHMNNLVPYEIENVRIRYYADNLAKGYAAGIEMKVNGEFVNGIQSWASIAVMQTREDIINDYYYNYFDTNGVRVNPAGVPAGAIGDSIRIEPGFIPRPTDQRVNFGLFFQDYLPSNPSFKMHLNLLFGTSLPFGPPSFERYKDTLRIPPYRRVDIGFSKQILYEGQPVPPKSPLRHFKSMWIRAEVFNLLQVNNVISYVWIKDVFNRQYAIPNFLTSRRLNIRLIAKF